jgi:hypothetical protein
MTKAVQLIIARKSHFALNAKRLSFVEFRLIHHLDDGSNDCNDEQCAKEYAKTYAYIHEIITRFFVHVMLRVLIAHVVTP